MLIIVAKVKKLKNILKTKILQLFVKYKMPRTFFQRMQIEKSDVLFSSKFLENFYRDNVHSRSLKW